MSYSRLSSLIDNENKSKKIEKIAEDEDKFDMICEINDIMFDRIVSQLKTLLVNKMHTLLDN